MAKWTEEQKLKALAIAEASSVREASKQTGIPEGSIKRWRSEVRENDPNRTERSEPSEPLTNHPDIHIEEDDEKGLTPKQRLFVKEYLVDLNATQAAIRAGYSEGTAHVQGPRMLENVRVKESIEQAIHEREQRTEITADKVLMQLAKIGFADIRDFLVLEDTVDEYGNLQQVLRLRPLNEIDGTLVAEMSQTKDGVKFKRNDQMKALELIGRHLGMFNKVEIEHSGEVNTKHEEHYSITHTIDEYTQSFANVLARRNSAVSGNIEGDRTGQSLYSAETDDETS